MSTTWDCNPETKKVSLFLTENKVSWVWMKAAFFIRGRGRKKEAVLILFSHPLDQDWQWGCLIFGLDSNIKFRTLQSPYSFCSSYSCVTQPFVHVHPSSGLRLPGFAVLCLINPSLDPSSLESPLSSLATRSRNPPASPTCAHLASHPLCV